MKKIFVLLMMSVIFQLNYAQSPREINDDELAKYQKEIRLDAIKLRQKLSKEEYDESLNKEFSIEFQIDTFCIERLLEKRIAINYSTAGIIRATYEAEMEYDKLLNKYYLMVLKRLKATDKPVLKQAQRNWILFRDSERIFNSSISKDEYSGGGTMQRVLVSNRNFEMTRERVFELIDYLKRSL